MPSAPCPQPGLQMILGADPPALTVPADAVFSLAETLAPRDAVRRQA